MEGTAATAQVLKVSEMQTSSASMRSSETRTMPSHGLSGSPGAVPEVLTDCDGGSTTCRETIERSALRSGHL